MEPKSADDLAAMRPVKAMATPTNTAKQLPESLQGADEDSVIRALGAALVMLWEDVPQDLQRQLFDQAAEAMKSDQSMQLREQLARFLHNHKDDAEGKR